MNKIFEQLASLEFSRVIIISVFVALAYYFMLYNDGSAIQASIASTDQELSVAQTKKDETDIALRQVQEMKSKVGELSAKFEQISRQLPSQLLSIDINKAIDDFARAAGVVVKAKRPGAEVRKNVVDEVPVEITVEGSYAQLAQFAYLVSQSEKAMRLTKVQITQVDGIDAITAKRIKMDGLVVGYKLAPPPKKDLIDPATGEVIQDPNGGTL